MFTQWVLVTPQGLPPVVLTALYTFTTLRCTRPFAYLPSEHCLRSTRITAPIAIGALILTALPQPSEPIRLRRTIQLTR